MAKKKTPKQATVQFTVPAFRHKGVEYKSADLEARITDGDVEAEALVAELVQKGSGVVQIVELDAAEVEAQAKAEAEAQAKAEAEAQAKADAKAKAEAEKAAAKEKAAAEKAAAKAKAKAEAEKAKSNKNPE